MPRYKVYITACATAIVEAKDDTEAKKNAIEDYTLGQDNCTFLDLTISEVEELEA